MVCIRIDINEAGINEVVLPMGLECSFCHVVLKKLYFSAFSLAWKVNAKALSSVHVLGFAKRMMSLQQKDIRVECLLWKEQNIGN